MVTCIVHVHNMFDNVRNVFVSLGKAQGLCVIPDGESWWMIKVMVTLSMLRKILFEEW